MTLTVCGVLLLLLLLFTTGSEQWPHLGENICGEERKCLKGHKMLIWIICMCISTYVYPRSWKVFMGEWL